MSRVEIKRDWQPVDLILRTKVDFAPLDAKLAAANAGIRENTALARRVVEQANHLKPAAAISTLRNLRSQVQGQIPILKIWKRALGRRVRVAQRVVRGWRWRIALRRFHLGVRNLIHSVATLAWRWSSAALGMVGRGARWVWRWVTSFGSPRPPEEDNNRV